MTEKAKKKATKKVKETKEALENSELETLKTEVETLTTQLEETKDKHLRLFAEFENYKKRTVKEKMELLSTAARKTIESLLPVLDDFDRAKTSAEDDDSIEQFSEGVTLVYHKIYSILDNAGLSPMESTGETFDPELHEAITEIPAPSEEQIGSVIDTVTKGYYLNDKIIRHAKVVVGK